MLQLGSMQLLTETNTGYTAWYHESVAGWLRAGAATGEISQALDDNTGFYTGIVTTASIRGKQNICGAFNVTGSNPTLGTRNSVEAGSLVSTLSGALDSVQVASYNASGGQGTATFDAGTVTVYYE
jgi:hypothetical protein